MIIGNMRNYLVKVLFGALLGCFCFGFSNQPIYVHHNPDSILKNPQTRPLFIGDRLRFATCADVRWFPDGKHLAVVYLLSCEIAIYSCDAMELTLIQKVNLKTSCGVSNPEKVVFSPDGKSVVVTHNKGVIFLPLEGHKIIAKEVFSLLREEENLVHNGIFNKTGNYFACTSAGSQKSIVLFKKEGMIYREIQRFSELPPYRKPKALLFSSDERYLVVVCSQAPNIQLKETVSSVLAVYPFNHTRGSIAKTPISMIELEGVLESLVFSPDFHTIYAADQALDRILSFSFDPTNGNLSNPQVFLKNPESELNFPHGIDISPDGTYLAVSNFGEDKITMYRLNE